MQETSKIYCDIFSILDLRQAYLSKLMDMESLVNYVNSEEYNFRNIDKFPVDMNEYNKILETTDPNIFSRATVTYVINTIRNKILNLEKRNNYYGESKLPEVILNIHPFILTEEQIKIIQNMLFIKLDSKCLITIINKPIDEITPYLIKTLDIIVCFIYDFSSWLNKHTDAVTALKIPDIIFYFPSLYKIEEDKKELEVITKTGFRDLFAYLEYMMSSVMKISFLPVVFYSNIITSSMILDKFNEEIKHTSLRKEGEENGDTSTKV